MIDEEIRAGDRTFRVTCLSMGNPHCVTYVDDVAGVPRRALRSAPREPRLVSRAARTSSSSRCAPRREVVQRTWERGAGETWACGTGAAAVCVAGVLTGRTDRALLIHLRGGDLELAWPESGNVFKTGPAVTVFEGEWPA